MIGGGPFDLEPGQWTDDTSVALCLAESLIEKRGFDPKDQMDRYCRWRDQGYLSSTGRRFDIGNTVENALSTYLRASNPFSGSESPNTAGNGSLRSLSSSAQNLNRQSIMLARVRVRRTGRKRPLMPVVISPGSSLVRSAVELKQSSLCRASFRVTKRIIGKRIL
jgi:ADP-ribosylglycohydrolase